MTEPCPCPICAQSRTVMKLTLKDVKGFSSQIMNVEAFSNGALAFIRGGGREVFLIDAKQVNELRAMLIGMVLG